jgi:DNA-binding HxlR family transcriptional regulator
VRRYGELKRLLPDISEKMLIQELKSLVEYGILEKRSYHEIPPRVEYVLTGRGRKVLPLIEAIKTFGIEMQEG